MSSSPEILVSGIAHLGGRLLFDSLTLQLRPGEWTALLGPSGSGKSTLLRLIAGLPVAAEFEGHIEADDKQGLSGRIGYMAQQDLLLEWATIRDNIALGSRLRGQACPPDRLADIIGAVGLDDKAEKRPCELSGGQRQRVALARTLLEDRPVILLDEPFLHLMHAPEQICRILPPATLLAGRYCWLPMIRARRCGYAVIFICFRIIGW